MLKKNNNRKFPLPWEGKGVLKEGVNKTTEAHKRLKRTQSRYFSEIQLLRRPTPEEFESGGRFNIQVNALNVFCPHDAGRI